MAKVKTTAEEYKSIFCKLYKYQVHGADTLIGLLTRYLRAKADYMASYIDLVSERSGVSPTGRITTTNADVMLPIVSAMIEIDSGEAPNHKELQKAWALFIEDYKHHKIKL